MLSFYLLVLTYISKFIFSQSQFYIQSNNWYSQATRKFRDPAAWMHVVVAIETPNADEPIKAWINGEKITEWDRDATPSVDSGENLAINSQVEHLIGDQSSGYQFSDMYISQWYLIDGQALTADDFGELDENNVWQPKTYQGSLGINGAYLKLC